jgi:amino acid transporter
VFVTAAFSFSGTELVGLAAAESENPGKSLPSAIKQVFWRVTLFYVLSLTFVGLLIDHDDERLLGNGSYIDVTASPFVIVAERAGVIGFAHFTNVVIMLSVVSIGLSGVYGGSRTLCALAEQGYAPRFFSYIDRAGRPLWATLFIIAWSPLAFMTLSTGGTVAFDWLQSLSGLAALFTWGSICFAHIRFRNAWKYHGHTVDEIPFTAIFGVTGSWIGLGLVIIVLIAQVSSCHDDKSSTAMSAPSLTFLPVLHRHLPSRRRELLQVLPRLLRRPVLLRHRLDLEAFGLEDPRADRRRLRPPRGRLGDRQRSACCLRQVARLEEIRQQVLLIY